MPKVFIESTSSKNVEFVFDDRAKERKLFEVTQHLFVAGRALVADAVKNIFSFVGAMSTSLDVVPMGAHPKFCEPFEVFWWNIWWEIGFRSKEGFSRVVEAQFFVGRSFQVPLGNEEFSTSFPDGLGTAEEA